MEKSIETIWKEGFLDSDALVAPKLNNLYDQKSKHLIDNLKRMFKINLIAIVAMAIVILIVYYFLDAAWQGISIAVMLIALAIYSKNQMQKVKSIDQGANSYDYLKSFHTWLKNALAKNTTIMRFFYPLTFLIAMSTIWFAGDNHKVLTNLLTEKFPDMTFVAGIPLSGLVAVGIVTLVMAYFSDKIYMWDVRLVYGRVFDKLEKTLVEMEDLKS